MFVCFKPWKKIIFGNWEEITAMTAIITKISQDALLPNKINVALWNNL